MADHIKQRVKIIFLVAHGLNDRNVTSILLCVLTEMDAHQASSCWLVCLSVCQVLTPKQMIQDFYLCLWDRGSYYITII